MRPHLSFQEWMHTLTPDGQQNQDEVRLVFLEIEEVLKNFKGQIDRYKLFLQIANCIYEQSG